MSLFPRQLRHLSALLSILSTTVSFSLFAQAPAIQWQRMFGGSDFEEAGGMTPTADGGYLMTGSTSSNNGDVSGHHGLTDFWIIKTNSAGIIEWKNTLGGTNYDYAASVAAAMDGSCFVAGYASSNDGDVAGNKGGYDFWVVKLSSQGEVLWSKTFGGTFLDFANTIKQTPDGGCIVAGNTGSSDGDVTGYHGSADFWVAKIDAEGNLQWQKALGGSYPDAALSINTSFDNGYIVAGNTASNDGDVSVNHGGQDVWVVKLNGSGDILWQKTLGGTGNETARSVSPAADGGYIVVGETASADGDVTNAHGQSDYWVVKINGTGNIQWQKTLGGSGLDVARAVHPTVDGGYVVAGTSESNDGDLAGSNKGSSDSWIVKFNSSGNLQWQKVLGGSSSDLVTSIYSTADSGYIIGGASSSNDGDVSGNHGSADLWMVKLGPDATLPVTFSALNARVSGNQLLVHWETALEINCAHYDIEASPDGKTFKKIGTVTSKATDGNSDSPLQYSFTTTTGNMIFAGLGLLSLLLLSTHRKRLVPVLVLLAVAGVCSFLSCNKEKGAPVDPDAKLFIRIAQTDKDGTVQYSRVVNAVKE